jgi:hypothetical protein
MCSKLLRNLYEIFIENNIFCMVKKYWKLLGNNSMGQNLLVEQSLQMFYHH